MPGEVDPSAGIVAGAFEHLDPALAKLAMKHIHPAFESMRRRTLLRRHWGLGRMLNTA